MVTVYRGKPCKVKQVLDPDTKHIKFELLDQTKPVLEVTITDPLQAHNGRTSVQMYVGSTGTIFLSELYIDAKNIGVFPWDPKEPAGEPLGMNREYLGIEATIIGRNDGVFLSGATKSEGTMPGDFGQIKTSELVIQVKTSGLIYTVPLLNGNLAGWTVDEPLDVGRSTTLFLSQEFVLNNKIPAGEQPLKTSALEWSKSSRGRGSEDSSTFAVFSQRHR